jgi:hypothetical protein
MGNCQRIESALTDTLSSQLEILEERECQCIEFPERGGPQEDISEGSTATPGWKTGADLWAACPDGAIANRLLKAIDDQLGPVLRVRVSVFSYQRNDTKTAAPWRPAYGGLHFPWLLVGWFFRGPFDCCPIHNPGLHERLECVVLRHRLPLSNSL